MFQSWRIYNRDWELLTEHKSIRPRFLGLTSKREEEIKHAGQSKFRIPIKIHGLEGEKKKNGTEQKIKTRWQECFHDWRKTHMERKASTLTLMKTRETDREEALQPVKGMLQFTFETSPTGWASVLTPWKTPFPPPRPSFLLLSLSSRKMGHDGGCWADAILFSAAAPVITIVLLCCWASVCHGPNPRLSCMWKPPYSWRLQSPLPLPEGYCAVGSALVRWLVQRWDKPHFESWELGSLDIPLSLKIPLGDSEEEYRHEYGCVFKVLGVSVEFPSGKDCPPWCE